jgi:hypothetical protein
MSYSIRYNQSGLVKELLAGWVKRKRNKSKKNKGTSPFILFVFVFYFCFLFLFFIFRLIKVFIQGLLYIKDYYYTLNLLYIKFIIYNMRIYR